MLTGKNVVLIKGEGDNYRAVVYPRIYLEFASSDPVENYTKTTGKKPITLPDGSEFVGVRPANDFSLAEDKLLMTEALNQAALDIQGSEDLTKAKASAWKLLLSYASYGRDLKDNARIRSEESGPATVDPAVTKARMLKSLASDYIARMTAKGKVVTAEQAVAYAIKKQAQLEEEDAQEAAA